MTNTNNALTAESISIQQICALRAESVSAGDMDQVGICDLALSGEIDVDDYTTLSRDCARALRTMTQEEAQEACADAINAARAMAAQ